MCYYQYVRQKDADKIYKFPVILGYLQFILITILAFDFCYRLYQYRDDKFTLFNFHVNIFNDDFLSHLLFKPWYNTLNILNYLLIFLTFLHILIFIVWRIIWLHFKIYDWKRRIWLYLSRRRKKKYNLLIMYMLDSNKIEQE